MKPIILNCTYEERISTKTNKPYKAVFVKLNDSYEKTLFLSYPEVALLEQEIQKQENNNVFDEFK